MIKDEYLIGLDSKPSLDSQLTYINKTGVIDEKILVIIPCNPGGANHGSYFLSGDYPHMRNNWRKTDIWLRNIRSDIYLAAQSCVEFKYKDGKGALVYEHEMMRVKNHFDFGKPKPDVFTFKDEPGFNMYKMVNDLKFGLNRALDYGFSRIISIQTPLFYKMGFSKAVTEMNLWDKVTLIDSGIFSFGYFLKMVNSLVKANITGILFDKEKSYKFTKDRIKNTPEEFQYNKYPIYQNIDEYFTRIKMKSNSFDHYLPILKIDEKLDFKDLNLKYEFPYNTPLYKLQSTIEHDYF